MTNNTESKELIIEEPMAEVIPGDISADEAVAIREYHLALANACKNDTTYSELLGILESLQAKATKVGEELLARRDEILKQPAIVALREKCVAAKEAIVENDKSSVDAIDQLHLDVQGAESMLAARKAAVEETEAAYYATVSRVAQKDHAFYCYLIDHIKYCLREEGEARFAYEEDAAKREGKLHDDLFRRRMYWTQEVTLANLMRDDYVNRMVSGNAEVITADRRRDRAKDALRELEKISKCAEENQQ